MSISIEDKKLDDAAKTYKEAVIKIVHKDYTTVTDEAKSACQGRFHKKPPCDACLLAVAVSHGLPILVQK